MHLWLLQVTTDKFIHHDPTDDDTSGEATAPRMYQRTLVSYTKAYRQVVMTHSHFVSVSFSHTLFCVCSLYIAISSLSLFLFAVPSLSLTHTLFALISQQISSCEVLASPGMLRG